MVQFLDRPKDLGERLAGAMQNAVPALAGALGEHQQNKQTLEKQRKDRAQEDEAIERLLGHNVRGLSPEVKKLYLQEAMKQQTAGQKLIGQQQEKNKGIQNAVSALDSLENLIEKPGIGMLGGFNPSDEARRNRGTFESTQAAILPLFKSMFPRGMTQTEFQSIMEHWIPQAGDTEEKIRGKINGLRMMIQNPEDVTPEKVLEGPANKQGQKMFKLGGNQQRPSLKSFYR